MCSASLPEPEHDAWSLLLCIAMYWMLGSGGSAEWPCSTGLPAAGAAKATAMVIMPASIMGRRLRHSMETPIELIRVSPQRTPKNGQSLILAKMPKCEKAANNLSSRKRADDTKTVDKSTCKMKDAGIPPRGMRRLETVHVTRCQKSHLACHTQPTHGPASGSQDLQNKTLEKTHTTEARTRRGGSACQETS